MRASSCSKIFLLCFLSLRSLLFAQVDEKPFVSALTYGGLGNNLFQVAAASALAWDNNATPCFPSLDQNSEKYKHVLFRCETHRYGKVSMTWTKANREAYAAIYETIPYQPNMQLDGYFQSEKYFLHHREEILNLFAPLPSDLKYMLTNYQWLIDHPKTVGVQIRYYRCEAAGHVFPQYDRNYIEKAMSLFPVDSLFIVSSNNLNFAKECIPSWAENVIFIENEPDYIHFYLLSFCKDIIITNSSFGWWAAWLNQNPFKVVVRPSFWVHHWNFDEVCPEDWVSVTASYH